MISGRAAVPRMRTDGGQRRIVPRRRQVQPDAARPGSTDRPRSSDRTRSACRRSRSRRARRAPCRSAPGARSCRRHGRPATAPRRGRGPSGTRRAAPSASRPAPSRRRVRLAGGREAGRSAGRFFSTTSMATTPDGRRQARGDVGAVDGQRARTASPCRRRRGRWWPGRWPRRSPGRCRSAGSPSGPGGSWRRPRAARLIRPEPVTEPPWPSTPLAWVTLTAFWAKSAFSGHVAQRQAGRAVVEAAALDGDLRRWRWDRPGVPPSVPCVRHLAGQAALAADQQVPQRPHLALGEELPAHRPLAGDGDAERRGGGLGRQHDAGVGVQALGVGGGERRGRALSPVSRPRTAPSTPEAAGASRARGRRPAWPPASPSSRAPRPCSARVGVDPPGQVLVEQAQRQRRSPGRARRRRRRTAGRRGRCGRRRRRRACSRALRSGPPKRSWAVSRVRRSRPPSRALPVEARRVAGLGRRPARRAPFRLQRAAARDWPSAWTA